MTIPCTQEENIGYIKATLQSLDKRINGSMDSVSEHIKQGNGWRKAIVGIVCAGVFQVISFAYLFGMLNQKVDGIKETQLKHLKDYAEKVQEHVFK